MSGVARETRIVAVANQKGGVGKTTTTVNLGVALARLGWRTLCIDLDPQGNASTGFGVEHDRGTPSTYDVVMLGRSIGDTAVPSGEAAGLSVLPGTMDLAGVDVELATAVARETRLRKALEPVMGDYDVVLIDCPPSLGLLTLNALTAATEILIPIQCEYYALEGVSQLLSMVELVQAHLNASLKVGAILLTMYDARTRLADDVIANVREHFGEVLLPTVIPRNVRVSEAPGFGQSVLSYDPSSRGALAYAQAARDFMGEPVVEGEQDTTVSKDAEQAALAGSAGRRHERHRGDSEGGGMSLVAGEQDPDPMREDITSTDAATDPVPDRPLTKVAQQTASVATDAVATTQVATQKASTQKPDTAMASADGDAVTAASLPGGLGWPLGRSGEGDEASHPSARRVALGWHADDVMPPVQESSR